MFLEIGINAEFFTSNSIISYDVHGTVVRCCLHNILQPHCTKYEIVSRYSTYWYILVCTDHVTVTGFRPRGLEGGQAVRTFPNTVSVRGSSGEHEGQSSPCAVISGWKRDSHDPSPVQQAQGFWFPDGQR